MNDCVYVSACKAEYMHVSMHVCECTNLCVCVCVCLTAQAQEGGKSKLYPEFCVFNEYVSTPSVE